MTIEEFRCLLQDKFRERNLDIVVELSKPLPVSERTTLFVTPRPIRPEPSEPETEVTTEEAPMKRLKSNAAEPVDPLTELLAMALTDRIKAVAKDVRSRKDRYAGIAAHELADALEVPEPERPTTNDWSMGCHVEIVSIEEYTKHFERPSETVYCLEEKVSVERFEELKQKFDQVEAGTRKTFRFLTHEERDIAESAINEEKLLDMKENGLGGIATYCVEHDGVVLDFEGEMEDDGSCIILQTPYDGRDGKFIDLENCLTEWW
jgi:hypothetical protein